MATTRAILKTYFETGKYPTEAQFAELIDSLRHKNEVIPMSDIQGLAAALNGKAPANLVDILNTLYEQLANHQLGGMTDEEKAQLNGLYERLQTFEELVQISVTPEQQIGIGTAEDMSSRTPESRAKIPTIGAIQDSIVEEFNSKIQLGMNRTFLIQEGNIDTQTGEILDGANYEHTSMLPLDDGYILAGASGAFYYSSPYFSSDAFLGFVGNLLYTNAPAGSKYVSYRFYNTDTSSLKILNKKDINAFLGDTAFKMYGNYMQTDESTRNSTLAFLKYAVKGLYVYGNGIDRSNNTYLFKFVQYTGNKLRMCVLTHVSGLTYNVLFDSSQFDVPSNGIVDTTISRNDISVRIIIDCNGMQTFSDTSNGNCFILTDRAFSPFIINPIEVEENIGHLLSVEETINDPDEIDILEPGMTVKSALSQVTISGKGINSTTGQIQGNTSVSCTPYIATKGIDAIRVRAEDFEPIYK